jgi:hypothetical protein
LIEKTNQWHFIAFFSRKCSQRSEIMKLKKTKYSQW